MAGIFHLTEREYVIARLEVAAANQLTTRVKASGHYLNRAPRLIKINHDPKQKHKLKQKYKLITQKNDPQQDRRLFIPRSDTQQ